MIITSKINRIITVTNIHLILPLRATIRNIITMNNDIPTKNASKLLLIFGRLFPANITPIFTNFFCYKSEHQGKNNNSLNNPTILSVTTLKTMYTITANTKALNMTARSSLPTWPFSSFIAMIIIFNYKNI